MAEKTKVNNYTVVKNSDVKENLNETELHIFNILLDKIGMNHPSRTYYVCNSDEPYSKEVLRVILDGEEKKGINYQDNILSTLKAVLGDCYDNGIKTGYKYDFCFVNYPLAGSLKQDLWKLIEKLKEEIREYKLLHEADFIKWNIIDLERIRDYDSFQDLYTGKLIIDTEN